jgi:hypothetical protein
MMAKRNVWITLCLKGEELEAKAFTAEDQANDHAFLQEDDPAPQVLEVVLTDLTAPQERALDAARERWLSDFKEDDGLQVRAR